MKLSEHFTSEEFTFSQTATRLGIKNIPDKHHIINMKRLCVNLLEPIRNYFDSPVIITSGYRSILLNHAVHGSKRSAHLFGCAADFHVLNYPLSAVFYSIYNSPEFNFNKMIYEFESWVHISYRRTNNNLAYVSTMDEFGLIDYEKIT